MNKWVEIRLWKICERSCQPWRWCVAILLSHLEESLWAGSGDYPKALIKQFRWVLVGITIPCDLSILKRFKKHISKFTKLWKRNLLDVNYVSKRAIAQFKILYILELHKNNKCVDLSIHTFQIKKKSATVFV